MEGTLIIQGLSIEQFTGSLQQLIKQAVNEEVKKVKLEELQEKLLSPAEVCKLFSPKISIGTVNNWAKEGLLKKHTIGNLTFYKYSEVIEALQTLKRYNRFTNPVSTPPKTNNHKHKTG